MRADSFIRRSYQLSLVSPVLLVIPVLPIDLWYFISVKRKFYQLAVIVVSLLIINGLSRNLLELWQQKKRVERIEQEVSDLEQQEVELKGQLRYYQSDEYVEKIAREKLLLGKEGETVLLLPSVFPTQSPITSHQSPDMVPFWKRWMRKLGFNF